MKANPKKWFPGHTAQISLRKVDRFAEAQKKYRPYFDTWEEAHLHMLIKAAATLERARRDVASATRHLAKVQGLTKPTPAPHQPASRTAQDGA